MENKTHFDLNNNWYYSPEFTMEMTKKEYSEQSMEAVRIPHTNVVTPYHYFDESIYQFVSCYRRKIEAPKEWMGKKVLLTFNGIAHIARVYLNEKLIGEHFCGYTAFTVDLGPHLNYEMENILVVEVDSREDNNIPPFGFVIDYMTYGGIYREVFIDVKESSYLEDVFVSTPQVAEPEKTVHVSVTVHSDKLGGLSVKNRVVSIENPEAQVKSEDVLFSQQIDIKDGTTEMEWKISNVFNWDIDHPKLYYLITELYQNQKLLDTKITRFGFRHCEFKKDGFYLNHKKIKLMGLNRHQSYPYVGYAMPRSIQQQDADILKNELFVNAVRTSHYPQSHHFIDRCDELGLLVFTEIPGWQHIGDNKWKEIACDNVKEMIMQYRNHPSIVLWGVRINESQDDDEFYAKTNQLAHELDQTRQTGGVRFLTKSNLLEDVYTYNDFLHNGRTKGLSDKKAVTSKPEAPYLVSEFNGHMFPTKAFDSEEHRLEHALRHARVLDSLFEQPEACGAFGWCMFDYNTHQDFGSGDRICYHGAMDMFRNPKLAAGVYASQLGEEPVCEISSTMDIGEHPAGYLKDVVAFTNADCIRLYKNEQLVKVFLPNKEKYPSLPHPPVIIDDFVGDLMEKGEQFSHKKAEKIKEVLLAIQKYGQNSLPLSYKLKALLLMVTEKFRFSDGLRLYLEYIGNWGGNAVTYRFDAVKDDKVVKVVEKGPVKKARLVYQVSSTKLLEGETYDAASVRIQAVDEDGNQLPYFQEAVTLEATGAIELIGPKHVSLKGGAAGTYVRTNGRAGEGELLIRQEQMGDDRIVFQVGRYE